MVIKKKEHFYSLTETEHNVLPVLTMQVWDNDTFTPDDFIGEHLMQSLHYSRFNHSFQSLMQSQLEDFVHNINLVSLHCSISMVCVVV